MHFKQPLWLSQCTKIARAELKTHIENSGCSTQRQIDKIESPAVHENLVVSKALQLLMPGSKHCFIMFMFASWTMFSRCYPLAISVNGIHDTPYTSPQAFRLTMPLLGVGLVHYILWCVVSFVFIDYNFC